MESVRKENLAAFIKSNRGSQKEIAKALGITSPTISE